MERRVALRQQGTEQVFLDASLSRARTSYSPEQVYGVAPEIFRGVTAGTWARFNGNALNPIVVSDTFAANIVVPRVNQAFGAESMTAESTSPFGALD